MSNMDNLRAEVAASVAAELERANAANPPFHSAHEGMAVICEEIWELGEEEAAVSELLTALWACVRQNRPNPAILGNLEKAAINAACEAIQVAAMCRKFRELEGYGDE